MAAWFAHLRWRAEGGWFVARGHPARALGIFLLWLPVFACVVWIVTLPSRMGGAWIVTIAGVITTVFVARMWSSALIVTAFGSVDVIGPIETDRLLLRRPRPEDQHPVAATLDADMLAANGWTMFQRRTWLAMVRLSKFLNSDHWIVTTKPDGTVVGVVSLSFDPADATPTLGCWMGSDARGRGYATEAIRSVIAALHREGSPRVVLGGHATNDAVRRVAEKVGARQVEQRPHTLPDGSTIDSVWYAHEAALVE